MYSFGVDVHVCVFPVGLGVLSVMPDLSDKSDLPGMPDMFVMSGLPGMSDLSGMCLMSGMSGMSDLSLLSDLSVCLPNDRFVGYK